MMLDPKSLRLFIAVVEEGTISAAAEREHIAAAAISRRISELEAQLKTKLLQRSNRGIEPTLAGITLLSMSHHLLHQMDEVMLQMYQFNNGVRGLVRVAANMSSITQFLPRDIRSFLEIHPDIQLNLEEGISSAVVRSVWENTADIGIFSRIPVDYEVEVIPYREDTICLVVPKDHVLLSKAQPSFIEALDYDFIGLHNGSSINYIVSSAAIECGRNLRIKILVTGFDALCLMVNSGLGIGVIPTNLARRYSKIFDIATVPIAEPWAHHRKLNICVRSVQSLPVAAKLFVDHLTDKARIKPSA